MDKILEFAKKLAEEKVRKKNKKRIGSGERISNYQTKNG